MDTYFAPPERLGQEELRREVASLTSNTIVTELLQAVSGLMAVLNHQRQILAINDALLQMLRIPSAEEILGLRLGETLGCVHAHEMIAGCGTSEYCSTCAAAIAMVTGLTLNRPVERDCTVECREAGQKRDLFFRVRSSPLCHENERLLLLFLQDLTYQQRLAGLERAFLHDIGGIVARLVGATYLLSADPRIDTRGVSSTIASLTNRLAGEVSVQRYLSRSAPDGYQLAYVHISFGDIVRDIATTFANHPVAAHKRLVLPKNVPDLHVTTEPSLLLRVLSNMITNAFEATAEGNEVRVWLEMTEENIVFCVWNREVIPADIARRVFQRNFSTKSEMGRGVGTYSMKMIGETVLGGTVSFTTSEEEGTIFRIKMRGLEESPYLSRQC